MSQNGSDPNDDPDVTLTLPTSMVHVVMAHLNVGQYQNVAPVVARIWEQLGPQLARYLQINVMAAAPAASDSRN